MFDWSVVESCLIGPWLRNASLCASRTIAQDKVATFMTMVCPESSTSVVHVLTHLFLLYCSAGFLAVMTVLLPLSWLTLLYASEALGLAFVAYTIVNSPGARVVHFDYTSPKYSHPFQARFRSYSFPCLLFQIAMVWYGLGIIARHRLIGALVFVSGLRHSLFLAAEVVLLLVYLLTPLFSCTVRASGLC